MVHRTGHGSGRAPKGKFHICWTCALPPPRSVDYNHYTMPNAILKPAWLVLLILPAAAQKKPITLDAVYNPRVSAETPGTAVWAPDGKTFVYRQGAKLFLYDPSKKRATEVIATDALDAAARSEEHT